jgi:hypothetical protein
LLPSSSIFLISLQPMDSRCDNRHTESWLIPCQDQWSPYFSTAHKWVMWWQIVKDIEKRQR